MLTGLNPTGERGQQCGDHRLRDSRTDVRLNQETKHKGTHEKDDKNRNNKQNCNHPAHLSPTIRKKSSLIQKDFHLLSNKNVFDNPVTNNFCC